MTIIGIEGIFLSLLLLGFLFIGFAFQVGIFFIGAIFIMLMLMLEVDSMLFYLMGAGLCSMFIFLAGRTSD